MDYPQTIGKTKKMKNITECIYNELDMNETLTPFKEAVGTLFNSISR